MIVKISGHEIADIEVYRAGEAGSEVPQLVLDEGAIEFDHDEDLLELAKKIAAVFGKKLVNSDARCDD
jgi:hypothetical protein